MLSEQVVVHPQKISAEILELDELGLSSQNRKQRSPACTICERLYLRSLLRSESKDLADTLLILPDIL